MKKKLSLISLTTFCWLHTHPCLTKGLIRQTSMVTLKRDNNGVIHVAVLWKILRDLLTLDFLKDKATNNYAIVKIFSHFISGISKFIDT